MQNVKKWKEPWKKQEPGERLSKRAQSDQKAGAIQRIKTAQQFDTQNVLIVCNKNLMLPPGMYKVFTVKVKIPMKEKDFLKRMEKAFPELEAK